MFAIFCSAAIPRWRDRFQSANIFAHSVSRQPRRFGNRRFLPIAFPADSLKLHDVIRKITLPSVIICALALAVYFYAHRNWHPLPPGTTIDRVVVEKAARKLSLFRDGRRLKSYFGRICPICNDSAAQAVHRQAESAQVELTYGRISIVVASGVTRQSSSISSSVSAMQPAVQSFRR